MAAALAVVFVESIVVTYFIGTSRWCKEVVETYQLDPAAVVGEQSAQAARRFPGRWPECWPSWASSPWAGRPTRRRCGPTRKAWANWHLIGAFLGIVFVAWTYLVAWNNIVANHAIIEQLVAEVGRVRRERGLDDGGSEADFSRTMGRQSAGLYWVIQPI